MDADLTSLTLSIAAQHGAMGESTQDPIVPETLGKHLAAEIRATDVEAIVVWDSLNDVVLGHVVARELDARLVTAFADEGILGFDPMTPDGLRVALLAYSWSTYPGLDALLNALEHSGATVTAVCALRTEDIPEVELPEGAQIVTLARTAE